MAPAVSNPALRRRHDPGACIELLRKFDFDGIWFDVISFAFVVRAGPVSCVCRHCAREFRKAAGCLPDAYDWSRPEFRRWVGGATICSTYWQRLTDAVRRAVPEAAIVFNHYHRENTNWHSGIHAGAVRQGFHQRFRADSEPLRAFYTRLMRAYSRPDTEVDGHGPGSQTDDPGPSAAPAPDVGFRAGLRHRRRPCQHRRRARDGGGAGAGGTGARTRSARPVPQPAFLAACGIACFATGGCLVFESNPDYIRPAKPAGTGTAWSDGTTCWRMPA